MSGEISGFGIEIVVVCRVRIGEEGVVLEDVVGVLLVLFFLVIDVVVIVFDVFCYFFEGFSYEEVVFVVDGWIFVFFDGVY